jgi:hypothetical protein
MSPDDETIEIIALRQQVRAAEDKLKKAQETSRELYVANVRLRSGMEQADNTIRALRAELEKKQ